MSCSYIGCDNPSYKILIHPITQLFIETCERHEEKIRKMILSGRKKKYTIYEQGTLEIP